MQAFLPYRFAKQPHKDRPYNGLQGTFLTRTVRQWPISGLAAPDSPLHPNITTQTVRLFGEMSYDLPRNCESEPKKPYLCNPNPRPGGEMVDTRDLCELFEIIICKRRREYLISSLP